MKNVGKRNSIDDRQNGLERERFEPFQQHPDLNAILNRIAEDANDRPFYNLQSPDYYFDETNAIDTKPLMPSRFHSFRTSTSRTNPGIEAQSDPYDNPDDSVWHMEKQQSLQQKQAALNGQKSHYLRQWNQQQINEKTDPTQQQQQQQKKPPLKSFDNNGDFMQSFDLN